MPNFAILAVIVGAVAAATHLAFQESRAGTMAFWLSLLLPYLCIAAFAVWRAHTDGVLRSWVRPKWGDFTRGFGGALALFAAAFALVKLVAPAGSPREGWLARLYLQFGDPSKLRDNVWPVAGMLVSMAILEEIVWRGLVTSLLEEKIGSRRAWVWAAVLYASAHAPTMWVLRDPKAGLNPTLVAAALGAGLVWGAMTRYFERLPPAIASHALFDWAVVMMFRLWGQSV
jgi:hypothetical protein